MPKKNRFEMLKILTKRNRLKKKKIRERVPNTNAYLNFN